MVFKKDGKGKKEWNTDYGLPPDCREIAYSTGSTVFLTTGVKNLKPCMNEARRTGSKLIVRVLPIKSSLDACRALGIDEKCIIAKRGPFSVDENRSVMKRFGAGVLVTI